MGMLSEQDDAAYYRQLTERLTASDDIDKYRSSQGFPYETPNAGGGYTSIQVLPFLTGLPVNNLALAYIHSLRPSSIRIGHCFTCDARGGRVTVSLDEQERIYQITMEVPVLYGAGYDVWQELRHQRRELGLPEPESH